MKYILGFLLLAMAACSTEPTSDISLNIPPGGHMRHCNIERGLETTPGHFDNIRIYGCDLDGARITVNKPMSNAWYSYNYSHNDGGFDAE